MKKIIALSAVAFLSTAVYAADADLQSQVEQLSKKLERLTKKVGEVNAQAAKDNIKFDVDFRTAVDKIEYETLGTGALGKQTYKNTGVWSNRLWLNMGYAPTDNMVFKGQLAYNKAFGAAPIGAAGSFAGGETFSVPQRGFGFDTFDWISSETLNDDKIRVREAYWLWMPKIGDIGFTASIGRRPSTNGYLANLREDDPKAKSPLGHVINMEFDGASAGIKLDKYVPGMMFKLCLGRGLTNAKAWANEADFTLSSYMSPTSPSYIEDANALDTIDMYGFIFVPYDDGQYALKTTWYRGKNVPGMVGSFTIDAAGPAFAMDQSWAMDTIGDMDGMAASLKIDGIGNEISDFLDETTFFASYAMSKSRPHARSGDMMTMTPAAGALMALMPAAQQQMMGSLMSVLDTGAMMGSDKEQTGHSYWLGINTPNLTGGRFGLEYNHGDKYWRPFTYGEDTLVGSKLATRGSAIEAYWSQPLIDDVFSMQVRYTSIKYDYTGSNGFFGDGGTPYSMSEARQLNQLFGMLGGAYDPVEKAQDLRVYFRYRY
ncbi:DUF3373 family protein [Sulfurimonas sp.]|uniref:DUF3373 family protein n=1 Tax=Sulfurimonas sp. TaxID=2022749 RepID=UPI00356588AB